MAREVTMKDVEDAYRLCGEPASSRKFVLIISSHIMIVNGYRREPAETQNSLLKTIRCLISAFLARLELNASIPA